MHGCWTISVSINSFGGYCAILCPKRSWLLVELLHVLPCDLVWPKLSGRRLHILTNTRCRYCDTDCMLLPGIFSSDEGRLTFIWPSWFLPSSSWPTYIYCLMLLCSKTGRGWNADITAMHISCFGRERLRKKKSSVLSCEHALLILIIGSVYCAKLCIREGKVSPATIERKSIL